MAVLTEEQRKARNATTTAVGNDVWEALKADTALHRPDEKQIAAAVGGCLGQVITTFKLDLDSVLNAVREAVEADPKWKPAPLPKDPEDRAYQIYRAGMLGISHACMRDPNGVPVEEVVSAAAAILHVLATEEAEMDVDEMVDLIRDYDASKHAEACEEAAKKAMLN